MALSSNNDRQLKSPKVADTMSIPVARPIPVDACDAHIHIFDGRFAEKLPVDDTSSIDATVEAYRAVQQRMGTRRTVIVTPRNYDTDNAVTVDAIRQLGIERTRGIAVLRPDVTNTQLDALHMNGIRGIRFTLYSPEHAPTRFDMVESLAHRVHSLGWHLQLHWTADQIVAHETLLARLPTTVVIDHFGRVPPSAGVDHPACRTIGRLLDNGRTWIKLSAPYLDSRVGEGERFTDVGVIARHWMAVAPERLVWGSDWPHTSETRKPDDVGLLSVLGTWANDEHMRRRILVDNPAKLYGFD